MRSAWFRVITLLATGLAASGCASLLKGTQEDVTIDSNPRGAKIFLNQEYVGTTPLRIGLAADRTYFLDLKKAGFLESNQNLTPSLQAGWVAADIVLTAGAGLIIDGGTGAWSGLPQLVKLQMEPAPNGAKARASTEAVSEEIEPPTEKPKAKVVKKSKPKRKKPKPAKSTP